MKKALPIILIVAICLGAGFGIGSLIGNCMKQKIEKAQYIGQNEIDFPDGRFTAEGLLALGRLSDPQLSPDGSKILFGVSYTSVEQNRSCRNIFVCDLDGSNRTQLTQSGKSINNARWSKDGNYIFYLKEGQIWKAPYKNGKLGRGTKLTEVENGISEFKLSADQVTFLYISTIPGAVQTPKQIDSRLDKAQAYVTEDLMYRHWDHWVTETPRTFVGNLSQLPVTADNSLDILGSEPFELPTEPFGGIEQLDWSPSGRHIVYSCRKRTGKEYAFSTNTDIFVYDLLTGMTVAVTNGGGYDTDPVWSPDGKHIAWISMARDGYEADQQRLMVCDVEEETEEDGQCFGLKFSNTRNLSAELDRDASGIFWNAESDRIIFNALTDGIQAIFQVNVDGEQAKVIRLTPEDWHYDFFSPFAAVSGEGKTDLLATYYSLSFPIELVDIAVCDGKAVEFKQIGSENGHILDKLSPIRTESVYVQTVDNQQMQCWVVYPPEFDENKVYPAIEIVLGGPQGSNSQDWSYRWCYRLMAEQGYIVMLPNRRGTTAFGQEWKEEISGDYCGLNMQDYLSAGRWIKSKPYVGKLACVGASYGGYSAYMLEGLHGDLYDCFIAHAGIFDEKMLWYSTEEMWFANWDNGGLTEYAYTPGQQGPAGDGITFGGMQQAGAPYASTPKAQRHYASSPESKVTLWHTPILCIHGMMDFRIPYDQGMAAFNAAQMMGVPSKLVIFPEENHWILQPQNSLLWHKEVYEWLGKWTKTGVLEEQ